MWLVTSVVFFNLCDATWVQVCRNILNSDGFLQKWWSSSALFCYSIWVYPAVSFLNSSCLDMFHTTLYLVRFQILNYLTFHFILRYELKWSIQISERSPIIVLIIQCLMAPMFVPYVTQVARWRVNCWTVIINISLLTTCVFVLRRFIKICHYSNL
jgi:hypothetical protein